MKSYIWSVSSVNVTFAGSTGLVHATGKSQEPQPPRVISPARNVTYRRIKVNFRLIKVKFSTELFSSPEPKAHRCAYRILMVQRPSVVVRPSVVNNFKRLLLRNRWADQSQILCGASLGRGNDILFAASGSHDQDGRHAHIW